MIKKTAKIQIRERIKRIMESIWQVILWKIMSIFCS